MCTVEELRNVAYLGLELLLMKWYILVHNIVTVFLKCSVNLYVVGLQKQSAKIS